MDANELKAQWQAARQAVQALQDAAAAKTAKGVKATAEEQTAFALAKADRDAKATAYRAAQ